MDNVKLADLERSLEDKHRKIPWWIREYEDIENGARLSAVVLCVIMLFTVLLFAYCMDVNRNLLTFCIIVLGAQALLFPFVLIMNPVTMWCYKKIRARNRRLQQSGRLL